MQRLSLLRSASREALNRRGRPRGIKLAFTLQSADDIFPTPLLRFEVADADKLNRALLKEIAQRRAAEGGMTKSNRRGWHSERDLFERKEPAQSTLAQIDSPNAGPSDDNWPPHTPISTMSICSLMAGSTSIRAAATMPRTIISAASGRASIT